MIMQKGFHNLKCIVPSFSSQTSSAAVLMGIMPPGIRQHILNFSVLGFGHITTSEHLEVFVLYEALACI